jgi:GNAT superfamily N-acetyltransferase
MYEDIMQFPTDLEQRLRRQVDLNVARSKLHFTVIAQIRMSDMVETIGTLVCTRVTGEWCVSSISVVPDFRGAGVGSSLLKRAILEIGTIKTSSRFTRRGREFMEHLADEGNATRDDRGYCIHFHSAGL